LARLNFLNTNTMKIPDEIIAALDQLGQQLRAMESGDSATINLAALKAGSDSGQPNKPVRQSWKQRIAAWWRSVKENAAALWNCATSAAKAVVQGILEKLSGISPRRNQDWIVVGLLVATAIAVVIATVKSFALIIGLLAAFGLLALVRIIQRLQTGLLV